MGCTHLYRWVISRNPVLQQKRSFLTGIQRRAETGNTRWIVVVDEDYAFEDAPVSLATTTINEVV